MRQLGKLKIIWPSDQQKVTGWWKIVVGRGDAFWGMQNFCNWVCNLFKKHIIKHKKVLKTELGVQLFAWPPQCVQVEFLPTLHSLSCILRIPN
jgi:hypothetical protein